MMDPQEETTPQVVDALSLAVACAWRIERPEYWSLSWFDGFTADWHLSQRHLFADIEMHTRTSLLIPHRVEVSA